MPPSSPLNCCPDPQTERLLTLLEESHRHERLLRCACGQHWFDRFHEDMDWRDGDDQMHNWYSRLTEDDADTLLNTVAQGERPDLSVLSERPCRYKSPSGQVREQHGAPVSAWPHR